MHTCTYACTITHTDIMHAYKHTNMHTSFVVCVSVCMHIYCAIYHTSNIASHPINRHRIPIVNGVAQSVVLVGSGAESLAAGGDHSMVLKKDGSVWTTGYNKYGQLGDGSNADKNRFVKVIGTCDMSLWSICALATPLASPLRLTERHFSLAYTYACTCRNTRSCT